MEASHLRRIRTICDRRWADASRSPRSLGCLYELQVERRKKMKLQAILATMVVCVLSVSAQAGEWDMNASSCTVASTSANRVQYFTSSVAFKSSATGAVTLYCPISFPQGITTISGIAFQYTDTAGDIHNHVSVSLQQHSHLSTVSGAIYGLNSYDFWCSHGGSSPTQCWTTFGPVTIDPVNDSYFVSVTLTRTTSANSEIFYGATVF